MEEKQSRKNASTLRKILIQNGREYKCEKCQIKDWQNDKIVIEVHHIDGNGINNDLSNLQFLCPNCHSQTENFRRKVIRHCEICKKQIFEKRKICYQCKPRRELPNIKSFIEDYNSLSVKDLCKKYKVGYTTIYKWLPKLGITKKLDKRTSNFKIKKQRQTKIIWPNKEDLQKLIWEKSTLELSKILNVSDKAIEKYCKKLGISKPPRGYWAKKYVGKL